MCVVGCRFLFCFFVVRRLSFVVCMSCLSFYDAGCWLLMCIGCCLLLDVLYVVMCVVC